MNEAATQRTGDTVQETLEEDNKKVKNISANIVTETATSSYASTSDLPDSKERQSASAGIDSSQSESVSRPLVSFMVQVGTGSEIADDLPRDSVVLEMVWVDGQNKNDLYQLFQFFQNKLLKGF